MSKRRKAFTLVELLTVIAVISVLAGVTVLGYASFIKKACISNDMLLVEQLNKFTNIYTYTKGNLAETEISEIIKNSGVNDITPQSQKYGYEFYFNRYSQRFELLHTSMAGDTERYILIDEELLKSDYNNNEADEGEIDSDISNGEEANPNIGDNKPDIGEDKDSETDTSDKGETDNNTNTSDKSETNDTDTPSVDDEPSFALEDFHDNYENKLKSVYACVEDGVLNIGIKMNSGICTESYTLDFSKLTVIDQNTGKQWSIEKYVFKETNGSGTLEFKECGRYLLYLILKNEEGVEKIFETTTFVRNIDFPQDAEVYVDRSCYEINRNGNKLEIILDKFRSSVEIMDYEINTDQRPQNSLFDNQDLRPKTTVTITFNGSTETVDIENKIYRSYTVPENYEGDITVIITVSYLGANGIEVSSSVTNVNSLWVQNEE